MTKKNNLNKSLTHTLTQFRAQHGKAPITYRQLELFLNNEARLPQRLATLPFFRPVKNRSLFDTDVNHGERVTTQWGYVIRFGPGLNLFDEDTLLAMFNLCAVRLLCYQQEHDHPVTIHAGYLTPTEINRFLGRDLSDDTLKETRQSIRRLQRNSIEIYHEEKNYTETVYFIKAKGSINAKGPLYIEIPPITVKWLDEFISLDLDLRKQLTPVGKAVHRFLSACPSTNQIPLTDLSDHIGFNSAITELRRALSPKNPTANSQLALMKAHGFLESYSIEGTGRSSPLVLHTKRRNS